MQIKKAFRRSDCGPYGLCVVLYTVVSLPPVTVVLEAIFNV